MKFVLGLMSALLLTSLATAGFCIQSMKLNSSLSNGLVQTINTDQWSMFQHDLNHTGASTSVGPATDNLLWTYKTGFSVFAGAAVVGNLVYVGSDDGYLYCLNAFAGTLVWSHMINSTFPFTGVTSPAVADGLVYVGGFDGKVYGLNAATGAFVWSYSTGSVVLSSPAVVNGFVYIGSEDDNVYCLNATLGTRVWNYTTRGSVNSSPAVVNGLVYVGSDDGYLYCLNATTGSFVWHSWMGYTGAGYSSPAVVGGFVYSGGNNDICCLNAATGAFVWRYTTGGFVASSPAVAAGFVYVGSCDQKVYCLNAATGAFVWSYTTGLFVASSPAVAGGFVYVGSDDHNVYCLDATIGARVWNYTTGSLVDAPPAVVNGVVYVGSYDDKIYAFASEVTTAGSAIGITGYKLMFNETMSNSLSLPSTIDYYWSYNADKWNGTQWVSAGISGSSTLTNGYSIPANTLVDLPYYVFLLPTSGPNAVRGGDWLKVSCSFHWTWNSTRYSTTAVLKLNVHPADTSGSAIVPPYFGSDGMVGTAALTLMARNWGKAVSWTGIYDPTDSLHRADTGMYGKVSTGDLTILATNWGAKGAWNNTPPPG